MEDDLNIFENGTQLKFFQMEDNLNFVSATYGAEIWYATLVQPN
jgi:hypothetical protein